MKYSMERTMVLTGVDPATRPQKNSTYPDFGVKKGTFLGEDTPGWCGK